MSVRRGHAPVRYQPSISDRYQNSQQASTQNRARFSQTSFNLRDPFTTGSTMTSVQSPHASTAELGLQTSMNSYMPPSLQVSQRFSQHAGSVITGVKIDRPTMTRHDKIRTQRQNRQRALQSRRLNSTAFHGFPRLPKELQLKIWKVLIPGPRIIELKAVTITEEVDEWSELSYERCIAQNGSPILLQICSTSRYLAQQM
ncbi:hypothetical protein N431DRAFT_209503 [Stipitochalara longipes BDJ]|nr:hypothetical protein N431DRAFT_209503 [Stipitochalara longipes BDJ]